MGRQPSGGASAEGLTIIPVAVAGTFRNFRIKLGTAPGTGVTRTFTVRKNGVDTALVVAISGTATTGSDTSNDISFAAGDYISIKHVVTGGTAAAVGYIGSSLEFEGDSTAIALGGCQVFSDAWSSDRFFPVMGTFGAGTSAPTSSSRETRSLFNVAGTITDFCYRVNFTTRSFSGTETLRLRKNNANEASTDLSVSSGTGTKTGSVGSLSITVAAGDEIEHMHDHVSGTELGTPDVYGWGIGFVPTTSGEFPISFNMGGNNAAVQYLWVGGNIQSTNSSSTEYFYPLTAIDITGGRCDLTAALTGSQTWDLQLQKNDSSGSGAMALAVGESSKTYTATDSFADDDLLSFSATDTNNPTSAPIRLGLTGKFAVAASTGGPILSGRTLKSLTLGRVLG